MSKKKTPILDALRSKGVKTRVAFARGGAEFVSVGGMALGSILVANVLLPEEYKAFKRWFAKSHIEPNLATYEKWTGKMPGLFGKANGADMHGEASEENEAVAPPEERAQNISDKIVDIFGLGFSMSMAGQIAGQALFNRIFKIPNIDNRELVLSAVVDRTVQVGGVYLLGRTLAEESHVLQSGVSNVLQNTAGMDKDTADRNAAFAVNMQIPNALGALASIGALIHFAKR